MPDRVLAVLTAPDAGSAVAEPFRFADPDAPVIEVLDLGVTRGDGVFETLGVGAGRAQAVDAHLARLARSAAMLELPEPDAAAWRAATIAVAERLSGPGGVREARLHARGRGHRAADGLGARLAVAGPHRGPHRRDRGHRARPRRAARQRGRAAVAAAGREDALLRREHGGAAGGEAPRRGRRALRELRRLPARGADLEPAASSAATGSSPPPRASASSRARRRRRRSGSRGSAG